MIGDGWWSRKRSLHRLFRLFFAVLKLGKDAQFRKLRGTATNDQRNFSLLSQSPLIILEIDTGEPFNPFVADCV